MLKKQHILNNCFPVRLSGYPNVGVHNEMWNCKIINWLVRKILFDPISQNHNYDINNHGLLFRFWDNIILSKRCPKLCQPIILKYRSFDKIEYIWSSPDRSLICKMLRSLMRRPIRINHGIVSISKFQKVNLDWEPLSLKL